MVYANSLHCQYLGTTSGKGLVHAYTLLQRKGLAATATKGVFHHDLNELIYHMGEAHVRLAWTAVAGVDNISELRHKAPEELLVLTEKVVMEHALSASLAQMQSQLAGQRDEVREQTVMWTRDVLHYIVLDRALKHGDVGLVENFLPLLLYRFVGGRNSKYAIEVLELLQGLNKEWPATVRSVLLGLSIVYLRFTHHLFDS